VARQAAAWLKRLGTPPRLELDYSSTYGDLLSNVGRHDEAIALYRRAVELATQVAGIRRRASPRSTTPRVAVRAHGPVRRGRARGREGDRHLRAGALARAGPRHRVDQPRDHALLPGRLGDAMPCLSKSGALLAPLADQARPYQAWNDAMRAQILERVASSWRPTRLSSVRSSTPTCSTRHPRRGAGRARAPAGAQARARRRGARRAGHGADGAQPGATDPRLRAFSLAMALWPRPRSTARAGQRGPRPGELRGREDGFLRQRIEA